jgi:integrator complex subunit 1
VTDLVGVAVLLSVTPPVKDAAAAFSKGDKKDIEILRKFHQQVAAIQRDGIWWLHTVVPSLAQLPEKDYTQCVRKILFLEPLEGYYMKDGWPPENERSVLLRLISEVAVLEDTLTRVLLLGLTDRPLLPQDAQEIVDKMVRRAAIAYSTDLPTIPCIEREELIDTVFRLSAYNYPEGIQLPRDYHPPKLAISKMYWKSWLILLILSACSPTTIGRIAWINYPTLRCMMEMVITNNYSFPPSGQTDEEKQRDLQIVCQEKEEILQFESYLAAATTKEVITEKSSHLLNQLMRMDPRGPPRKPPTPVMDQLKFAAKRMSLGHKLCKSRDPDFLLSIIQKQGTTQSMTWLVDLIQSSSGSLDLLPVQCLCEFLLLESDEKEKEHGHKRDAKGKREQGIAQQHQLLDRLHSMLMGTEAEVNTTASIIEYFLERLPSEQPQTRAQGLKGLKLILSGPQGWSEEDSSTNKRSFKWLLEKLPTLRHFHDIKNDVCTALRKACKVETDTEVVTAYLIFLSQHSIDNDLVGLSLELASIITYRISLSDRLLSSAENLVSSSTELRDKSLKALITIFVSHLTNALRTSEPPDIEQRELIIVQWRDGKMAFLHWSVIRAMVVILTRGPPSEDQEQYWQLMEAWFPKNDPQPVCFIMQTREQAYIFEQGLKLCMIRSPVAQLVTAALEASALEELLIFVQSFGIPVESMSCLLQKLDETAREQPNALQAVLNDPNSPSDSGK